MGTTMAMPRRCTVCGASYTPTYPAEYPAASRCHSCSIDRQMSSVMRRVESLAGDIECETRARRTNEHIIGVQIQDNTTRLAELKEQVNILTIQERREKNQQESEERQLRERLEHDIEKLKIENDMKSKELDEKSKEVESAVEIARQETMKAKEINKALDKISNAKKPQAETMQMVLHKFYDDDAIGQVKLGTENSPDNPLPYEKRNRKRGKVHTAPLLNRATELK